MSPDRATQLRTPAATVDVAGVTTRCLLYALLPSWFVPGPADWVMHRRSKRTRITGKGP